MRSMRHRLNPKRHDLASIVGSIRRFGFTILSASTSTEASSSPGMGASRQLPRSSATRAPATGSPVAPSNVQVDSDGRVKPFPR